MIDRVVDFKIHWEGSKGKAEAGSVFQQSHPIPRLSEKIIGNKERENPTKIAMEQFDIISFEWFRIQFLSEL